MHSIACQISNLIPVGVYSVRLWNVFFWHFREICSRDVAVRKLALWLDSTSVVLIRTSTAHPQCALRLALSPTARLDTRLFEN